MNLEVSFNSCDLFSVFIPVLCVEQDQAFGELEKNSDKLQQGTSSSDSSQPAHLHQLLCSLQKQLLAYCHINSVTEVWTLEPNPLILLIYTLNLFPCCVSNSTTSLST